MVTASHLPADRNGLKFFTKDGGFDKRDIKELVDYAMLEAQSWHDQGILPPTSGTDAVFCSEWVSRTSGRNGFRKALLIRVASSAGRSYASLCIDTQECHSKGSGLG